MNNDAMDRIQGRRRISAVWTGKQQREAFAVPLPAAMRHAQLVVTTDCQTGRVALAIDGLDEGDEK